MNEDFYPSIQWSSDGKDLAWLDKGTLQVYELASRQLKKSSLNGGVVNQIVGQLKDSWIMGQFFDNKADMLWEIGLKTNWVPKEIVGKGIITLNQSGYISVDEDQINISKSNNDESMKIPEGLTAIESREGKILFRSADSEKSAVWEGIARSFYYFSAPVQGLDLVSPNGMAAIKSIVLQTNNGLITIQSIHCGYPIKVFNMMGWRSLSLISSIKISRY